MQLFFWKRFSCKKEVAKSIKRFVINDEDLYFYLQYFAVKQMILINLKKTLFNLKIL